MSTSKLLRELTSQDLQDALGEMNTSTITQVLPASKWAWNTAQERYCCDYIIVYEEAAAYVEGNLEPVTPARQKAEATKAKADYARAKADYVKAADYAYAKATKAKAAAYAEAEAAKAKANAYDACAKAAETAGAKANAYAEAANAYLETTTP